MAQIARAGTWPRSASIPSRYVRIVGEGYSFSPRHQQRPAQRGGEGADQLELAPASSVEGDLRLGCDSCFLHRGPQLVEPEERPQRIERFGLVVDDNQQRVVHRSVRCVADDAIRERGLRMVPAGYGRFRPRLVLVERLGQARITDHNSRSAIHAQPVAALDSELFTVMMIGVPHVTDPGTAPESSLTGYQVAMTRHGAPEPSSQGIGPTKPRAPRGGILPRSARFPPRISLWPETQNGRRMWPSFPDRDSWCPPRSPPGSASPPASRSPRWRTRGSSGRGIRSHRGRCPRFRPCPTSPSSCRPAPFPGCARVCARRRPDPLVPPWRWNWRRPCGERHAGPEEGTPGERGTILAGVMMSVTICYSGSAHKGFPSSSDSDSTLLGQAAAVFGPMS